MWIRSFIITMAIFSFLSSCKVKKPKIQPVLPSNEVSNIEKTRILTEIENSKINYSTFKGKAKAKLNINNDSFNATLNTRIRHQEAIWISITALLGIEVARVLITPNRIQIINRLEKEYIDKPFHYIYQYTSEEFSFNEIESLFSGKVMPFAINNETVILSNLNGFDLQGNKRDINFSMHIENDYTLKSAVFSQTQNGQKLSSYYDSYQEVQGQNAPSSVQIVINTDRLNLDAFMNYNSISFNEEFELPFSIPSGYTIRE